MIIKNIKGTLDLFNDKIININYILKIIKKNFKLYGFLEIKTPLIEDINIIKYINKNINNNLLYFIKNKKKKKFLIFDLTIPLIRFLLTNNNKLIFPFKRYQIQKVWRGEKPQKNRYREFYQCDIDIINFKSNFEELEIISICNNIFKNLKINIFFFINHKDIIYGLCEYLNLPKKKWFFFIKIIDKIDKKGKIKIINILKKKIKIISIKKFKKLLNFKKKNIKFLMALKKKFKKNKKYGLKGINYLIKLLLYFKKIKIKKIKFNLFLSRGLDYYTKTIFEIKEENIKKKKNLSLGGGGRYDNLFKIKNKKIKGIGISLGLYRIYNIYKNNNNIIINNNKKKCIILNFGIKNYFIYYKYANILRKKKIITEIYPYKEKIKKQIKYALKKNIKFLIIIGEKEIKNKIIKIKNLSKKIEKKFNKIEKIIKYIKKWNAE
ncbi:MAG: histidine--tRNA ligase [Candidatus Shikimatogenerans bostrichidophilus]|nr:MAG: histidine--tRNA ligase [Candidatus Shikimatogenerans bostrichidophilus]